MLIITLVLVTIGVAMVLIFTSNWFGRMIFIEQRKIYMEMLRRSADELFNQIMSLNLKTG